MSRELASTIAYMLMELIYTVIIYKYYKIFFDKKSIKGSFAYIYLISVFVQSVQIYIPDNLTYCRVIMVTVYLNLITLFFIGGYGERIVVALLLMAMHMMAEALVGCMFLLFGLSGGEYGCIGTLVTDFILWIIVIVLDKYLKSNIINSLPWKTNLKIMLIPIGSMFIAYRVFYTQYQMGIQGFYWKTMISIIILFCINVIIFNIIAQLSENLELQRKTAIYEKEFALLEQYMHERENLMRDFRVKRHDLKHQMLNLLSLLQEHKYEKLELDLQNLAELKPFNELFIINTQNSFIDTLVNSKYTVAHEKGITFNVNIDVPVELPIAGEDLCVILGNALDNAIEACLRGKVENPCIMLKIIYDGENLIIIIKNTFDGKINKGKYLTRKHDVQQHGMGIYSIKHTITKYKGTYNVEIKQNWYCLEIILHT